MLAVGLKCDLLDAVFVLETKSLLARFQVPYFQLAPGGMPIPINSLVMSTTGDQGFPIRTESDAIDGERMSLRGENLFTGVNIPDSHLVAVASTGYAVTVWTKHQQPRGSPNGAFVPSCRRVPNLDAVIANACDMVAIRADRGSTSSEGEQLGMAKPPEVVP